MKRLVVALVLLVVAAGIEAPAQSALTVPAGAAVQLSKPHGVTVGAFWQSQSREMQAGGRVIDVDAWHAWVQAGFEPLSWLALSAGAGATRAAIEREEGSSGSDWLVRADAALLELVLADSPVLGRKKLVRLSTAAAYRESVSNASEGDFEWQELSLEPRVSYTVNLRGPDRWHRYDPTAATVRLGLVYSDIDGQYAGSDVDQNQDFGISLGGALQFASGVSASVDVQSFEEASYNVTAGVSYTF